MTLWWWQSISFEERMIPRRRTWWDIFSRSWCMIIRWVLSYYTSARDGFNDCVWKRYQCTFTATYLTETSYSIFERSEFYDHNHMPPEWFLAGVRSLCLRDPIKHSRLSRFKGTCYLIVRVPVRFNQVALSLHGRWPRRPWRPDSPSPSPRSHLQYSSTTPMAHVQLRYVTQ